MLAGRPPYGGANQSELVENIRTQEIRLPAGVRIGGACVDLLQMLLQRKPHKRASFERVMAADFLRRAPAPASASATATATTATTSMAANTAPVNAAAAAAAAPAANNSSGLRDAGGLGSTPLVACSPPSSGGGGAGGSRARAMSSPAHMHYGGVTTAAANSGGGATSALSPTSELVAGGAVHSQVPPPLPQGPSNLAVQLHKANTATTTGATIGAPSGSGGSGLQTQLVARLPRRSSSGDSIDSAGSGGDRGGHHQQPFPHPNGGSSPYGSPGFASCNVLAQHASGGHHSHNTNAGYLGSGGSGGPLTLQSVHHHPGNGGSHVSGSARSSSGTLTGAAHPQASYLAGYQHPNPVPSNHYLQQAPYQAPYPNSSLPLQQFPFPSMPPQHHHYQQHGHGHAERPPPQVFAHPLTASPPQKATSAGGVAGYLLERRSSLDACYLEQDTILQRLAPSTTPSRPSPPPASTTTTSTTATTPPPLIAAASRSPQPASSHQRVESLERNSSRGGPPPTLGTVAEGGTEGSDEWFVVDAVDGTCGDVVSSTSDRYEGHGTSATAAAASASAADEATQAVAHPSHLAPSSPTYQSSEEHAAEAEPWLLAEPAATILERVESALGSIELLGRCAMAVARVGDAAAALVLSGSSLEGAGGGGDHGSSSGSSSSGQQRRERSRARAFSAPPTLALSDAPNDVSSSNSHQYPSPSNDARSPPSTLSPASAGLLPQAQVSESGSGGGDGGDDGSTATTAAMAIPQGNDRRGSSSSSSQGGRNHSYESCSPNGLLLRRAGESPVSDKCGSPGDALCLGGQPAGSSSKNSGGAHVGTPPYMGGSMHSPHQHRSSSSSSSSSANNEHLGDALLLYLKAMNLVKRAVELGRALAYDARQRPPPTQAPLSGPTALSEAPLADGLTNEGSPNQQQLPPGSASGEYMWDVASAAAEAEAVARAEQLEAWLASQYALLLDRAEQCRHSVSFSSSSFSGTSPHATPPSPSHGGASSVKTAHQKSSSSVGPGLSGDGATATLTATTTTKTAATLATTPPSSAGGNNNGNNGGRGSGSSSGGSLRRAEQRVYRAALQAARAAAVKEVLGAPELALKLYQHGQYLVESLLLEPQLPPNDRQVLGGYDSSFQQRIDALDRVLRPELYPAPPEASKAPVASETDPSSSGTAGAAAAGGGGDNTGGRRECDNEPHSPLSPSPAAPGSPPSAKSSGHGSGGVSEQMDTLADLLAVPPPNCADARGYGSTQLTDLCVPPPLAMLTAPRGLASPRHLHHGGVHKATSSNNHATGGGGGDGNNGQGPYNPARRHGAQHHHEDDFIGGGAVGFLGSSTGDFGNGDAAFM